MKKPARYEGWGSVFMAIIGVLIFSISLILLVTWDIEAPFLWVVVPLMFWQTFLFTGLFITVHDSMHHSILPKNIKINDLIGTISVFFYALFSYKKLKKKHWDHHRNPGTMEDPDYHDGKNKGFFRWYLRFLIQYLSPFQLIGMGLIFNILIFIVGLSWVNLVLFWMIPSIGSTFQLFYFGTYLPHREPDGGYTNRHHARSTTLPWFLSLITCFHFGHHLEHHKYPYVQWWRLPWIPKDTSEK